MSLTDSLNGLASAALPPGGHWQPVYQLLYNGRDISSDLRGRLLDLTLRDQRGFESDQLDITLDDSDGALPLPSAGATLQLALGWAHTGLIDKGSFQIDDVEHEGAPDRIMIRARSANMAGTLTEKREQSWHRQTIGSIVQTIAKRAGLTPSVADALASVQVAHLDQAGESDANLLTRLAEQHDAIASVKQGRLLFMPASHSQTVSGQTVPPLLITRAEGDQHRYSLGAGQAYTKVKASYYDTKTGKKGEVVVDENTPPVLPKSKRKKTRGGKASPPPAKPAGTSTSSTDPAVENILVLRHTYASADNAQRGAQAALQKAKRGVASFSITLARGNPAIYPETPAVLAGFKPQIDAEAWVVTQCTHSLNEARLSTSVEFEVALAQQG